MTHFNPLLGASALALLVSASGAVADVSAADVWDQWQELFSRSGQTTLSVGSESQIGDTLTVRDLKIQMTGPEMAMLATLASVTFRENGDGTVTIGMPDDYPLTLDMTPAGEAPAKAELSVHQAGMTVIAAGTPDAISYAYSGDTISVTLDDATGGDMPEDMLLTGSFTLSGFAGVYDVEAGDPQPLNATLAARTLEIALQGSSASEGGDMSFTLKADDIQSKSSSATPAAVDYADMAKALADGFQVAADITFGNTTYALDVRDESETVKIDAAMASGGLDFAMSADGMHYKTDANGLDMRIAGSDMPLPEIAFKLAQSSFGLTMPLVRSDTPQDLGLLLQMVGLEIQPELWGMLDPGGTLPHDAATIILDIVGKGNWLIDILTPDAQQGMAETGLPGDLKSLDLKQLQVSAVGADVSGSGAFTFDSSNMEAWGFPAPDGAIDLKLVGVTGLIDKLVSMYLIPKAEAEQIKGMMGLFATPGSEPDTFTSKIEVTADGHLSANGMRLK